MTGLIKTKLKSDEDSIDGFAYFIDGRQTTYSQGESFGFDSKVKTNQFFLRGKGSMTYSSGKVLTGTWGDRGNGQWSLVGEGSVTGSNGTVYTGNPR